MSILMLIVSKKRETMTTIYQLCLHQSIDIAKLVAFVDLKKKVDFFHTRGVGVSPKSKFSRGGGFFGLLSTIFLKEFCPISPSIG